MSQADKSPEFWPVTFEEVEEAQLRDALKATPAQRLAIAEALLELAILVNQFKN